MQKNEIKDIIEAWRTRNIRPNSVWRDPRKAKDIGETGWVLFIFTAAVVVIFAAASGPMDELTTEVDALKFREITIENLECSELKKISLLVESNNFRWDNTRDKITAQLLARC